jgi:hypothetical protein
MNVVIIISCSIPGETDYDSNGSSNLTPMTGLRESSPVFPEPPQLVRKAVISNISAELV